MIASVAVNNSAITLHHNGVCTQHFTPLALDYWLHNTISIPLISQHGTRMSYSYQRSSSQSGLAFYLSPRQRLDSLFTIHAAFSIFIGALGYIWPGSAGVFFLTESDREFSVARAILRPYCSLVLAQGVMIWRARKINDGEIKRAFVQAYFVCFLLSTVSLIIEHIQNSGVLSGKLFGTAKIFSMIFLTAGYGWFTFFQPPTVFSGLATRSHYQ